MNPEYIADYICTYNLIDEYKSSLWLYQIQILQAFNLEQFDDDKINSITEQLYEKYKDNTYISTIIQKSLLFSQPDTIDKDNLTKFRICFSYNTFYLIHSILCSLINNIKINEINYNKLLNFTATT